MGSTRAGIVWSKITPEQKKKVLLLVFVFLIAAIIAGTLIIMSIPNVFRTPN